MFALDPLHPVYNSILDALIEKPSMTIAELHEILKKKYKLELSLQHVYRTVNRLVEEQILIKAKGEVSVNLMWLSYLSFFAERGRKALSTKHSQESVLLKEGERKHFDVDTLADVQTVWNHLLVSLHRVAPEKFLFKYYAHVWWQLGKHALDPDFYKTIRERGVTCYWLYGNDSFLDRETLKKSGDLLDWRIAEDPPFPKEGFNINIYGDYILECIFPERISKHLAMFFQGVDGWERFDEDILEDIYTMKGKFRVTLWRSASQAAVLRAKIIQYFLKTADRGGE